MADTKSREAWGLTNQRGARFTGLYPAGGVINPNRFVIPGFGNAVVQSDDLNASVLGVYRGAKPCAAGDLVEIEETGVLIVESDGTAARGALVASDADGRAKAIAEATAVATIGAAWQIAGLCLDDGPVAGDTVRILRKG